MRAGFFAALAACTYDFDRFSAPAGAGGSGGESDAEAGEGNSAPSAGQSGAAQGGALPAGGSSADGGVSGGGNGGKAAGGASAGSSPTGGASPGGADQGGTGGGSASFDCAQMKGTTHGDDCYFVLGADVGLSWSAAKSACASYSARLVSITSAEEQAAIAAAFFPSSVDYWIGLALADVTRDPPRSCQRTPSSCPFDWESGEPLGYANWGNHSATDAEPNYTGACVRLVSADASWADYECPRELAAICEHSG